MFLKRLLYYLNPVTLFRRGSHDPSLKFMHGVNRISLFMFLLCVVVMLVRSMDR